MKVFAVILSLFIFTLSAASYEEIGSLFGKQEIARCAGDAQGCNDDCPLSCSPFHLCSSCMGFTIPMGHQTVQISPKDGQKNEIHYIGQFVSSFEGSIWQPPKIG